jgi:hypothetical protein
MGIDISSYGGMGVHIPKDSDWVKGFDDRWAANEALENLIYQDENSQGLFTLVWAQDSWSGTDDGWVVYVNTATLDSDREYLFLKMGRVNIPKHVKDKLEILLAPVVDKIFIEPIAIVTVT